MSPLEAVITVVVDRAFDEDLSPESTTAALVALFEPHRMGMWDIEVPGLWRLSDAIPADVVAAAQRVASWATERISPQPSSSGPTQPNQET